MCSETSHRVSFSHDLIQPTTELNESRRDTMLLDSCPDFEFDICSFEQQYSSADELFANGMILPEVRKNVKSHWLFHFLHGLNPRRSKVEERNGGKATFQFILGFQEK
ncbi:hypothetical protein V6N11_011888 [Hibiscus sabdariffa]|uniref:Uncharacterized protein n=1 Tax=Hibiscus sabdariffa TaxID=183260 RepID=A0ABR2S9K0_9ROSI